MMPSRVSNNNSFHQNNESNPAMIPFLNSEKIFQKDLQMKVLINNAQQSHPITFSLLVPRSAVFNRIIVLFTSKDDLYFLYSLQYFYMIIKRINKQKIYELNAEYNLKLQGLEDFVDMFRQLIIDIEKQSKRACLKFSNQNTLTLQITTLINGKEFQILSLVGDKEESDITQQWTALKYGQMRQQIRRYQQKIYQLRQLVRVKNPYLFTYINKIQ